MASQLLGIKTRFTNDLGSPLVGGQVYTFFAGTSTPQDTFSDAALTIPNTNPVILDDTGSADIFLKGSYRIRVFDKSGRFIEEQDNVTQAASQGDATELSNKVTTLENGLSAANTEINKVKLDTGITATAKFGGVERTQAEKNSDFVSAKDFGAVGDGVTDDSNAIERLLQFEGSKSLTEGDTYRITRSLLGLAGTFLHGNGATILVDLPDDADGGALEFAGLIDDAVTATTTANIYKGTSGHTITGLSSNPFKVGDTIRISSNQYKHGIDGVSGLGVKTRGEYSEVLTSTGSTITLTESIKDDYTEGTKTITKVVFCDDVKLHNIKFINNKGNANSTTLDLFTGARAVVTKYCRNFQLVGCSFSNFRRYGAELLGNKNSYICHNYISGYDMTDPTNAPVVSEWFTGINAGSCENTIFANNEGKNCRRIFDCDSYTSYKVFSRNVIISGNVSTNCGQLAGTHACQNVLVEHNVGNDSGAIWVRGIDVSIQNNRLQGQGDASAKHQGIRVGMGTPFTDTAFPLGTVNISNNVLTDSTAYGININGDVDGLTVIGNTVQCYESPISIVGQSAKNITITGNTLSSRARAVIYIPNYIACPRKVLYNISITGNSLTIEDGAYGSGVIISGASRETPADCITITGNTFRGITVRNIGFTFSGSGDSQGYYGDAISTSGNSFGLNSSPEADIVLKQLNNKALTEGSNSSANSKTPTRVVSATNGEVPNAYTYEKGMFSLEDNPVAGGFWGYTCVSAGTKSTFFNGKGAISSGSKQLTMSYRGERLVIGSYISVAAAGITSAKVLAIVGDTATLSVSATTTVSDSDVQWVLPTFKGFGVISA